MQNPIRMHRLDPEKGFTLIELLVVIIIIGILAAVAIPLFLDQRKLAVDASIKADVRDTVANVQTWLASNPNTAVASTRAWVNGSAPGQPAVSGTNSIGVKIDASGSYQVCGYNADAKKYTANSAAFSFDAATGNFTTGTCATGSDDGGSTASLASKSYTLDAENATGDNQYWSFTGGAAASSFSTDYAYSGTRSVKAPYGGGTSNLAYIRVPGLALGKSYTFSGQLYIPSQTGDTSARLVTLVGTYGVSPYPDVLTKSANIARDKWVPFSYTFTVPSNGDSSTITQFYAYASGSNPSGALYVDQWAVTPN